MAIGTAPTQRKFEDAALLLGDRLQEGTLYRLLADHGHALFPDEYFADLYTDSVRGRPTIPARVVATTMLLQAYEGLSDREACDRLEFDLRWQACAGLPAAADSFHPTLLVGVRNRLRASDRPRRLFDDTVIRAKRSGVVSRKIRVLDSTPLLDAVATQDTVTQLRAAIRRVLRSALPALASRVRDALARDDDYASPGRPPCDWDDAAAREQLVDELVHDALAALDVLHGAPLEGQAADDAALLALVAGQDVEESPDGRFRIVRGTAKDRVISTVDPEARHGHKSQARHFDGYKTHLSADPESEIITQVVVTPANAPDRSALTELLDEAEPDDNPHIEDEPDRPTVVGDSAYADGATRQALAEAGHEVVSKVPPVRNTHGGFTKDRFRIDLQANTVTCPANVTVVITARTDGSGSAHFGQACAGCRLRAQCTTARTGRRVSIHRYEQILQQAKGEQRTQEWQATYRSNRPIAERTMSRFARRSHGGRKARCRGVARVLTDALHRAAALNLAKLARLALVPHPI